jgi:hypothetical protein
MKIPARLGDFYLVLAPLALFCLGNVFLVCSEVYCQAVVWTQNDLQNCMCRGVHIESGYVIKWKSKSHFHLATCKCKSSVIYTQHCLNYSQSNFRRSHMLGSKSRIGCDIMRCSGSYPKQLRVDVFNSNTLQSKTALGYKSKIVPNM